MSISITTSDLLATDTAVTGYARQDYLNLFPNPREAVEFENQALSVGREFLPAAAQAVLDGGEATSDYYAWLADQVAQDGAPTTPTTPAPYTFYPVRTPENSDLNDWLTEVGGGPELAGSREEAQALADTFGCTVKLLGPTGEVLGEVSAAAESAPL